MTQIEDRLRDALATAPTPASATTDPVADLERRIGRRRRRRTAVAIVVAAVAAVIVVPLLLSGSASNRPAPPTAPPGVTKVFKDDGAVASGGGYVWTLRPDFRHNHRGAPPGLVMQREPGTLRVVRTYRVPGPADFVSYGLGRVWVYGGGIGADGYRSVKLSVVNPATGHRTTLPLGRRPIGDLAFQSGRAWMLGQAPEELVPLELNGDQVRFGRAIPAPTATTLAAGNGLIYALAAPHGAIGAESTVAVVSAVTGRPAVTQRPDGHVLLVLPDGYLVVRHHRLVAEGVSRLVLGPSLLGRVGQAHATFDPATGAVYVVTITGNCKFFRCQQELKYSLSDLARGTRHPLAVAHSNSHGGVFSLAADPSGSLLMTDGQSLYRWTPSP